MPAEDLTSSGPGTLSLTEALAGAAKLSSTGKDRAAEALLRRVLELEPGAHPALHQLALLRLKQGLPREAVLFWYRAVHIDGAAAVYWRNLGEVYRQLGDLGRGRAACERAVELTPGDAGAHYNLGLIYSTEGNLRKAQQAYQRAIELDPAHSEVWNNLGAALNEMGDIDGAERAYRRAIECRPGNAEAHNNLGAILSEAGELDGAATCFTSALAHKPDFVSAHFNLSSLKTYQPGDPHLATLESMQPVAATFEREDAVQYFFALGKAREDAGQYHDAFDAYARGNELKFAESGHDPVRSDAFQKHVIDVFSADFIAAQRPQQPDHRIPIFILGMPRSGTSLMEQILSSHPDVYGAGELPNLYDVAVSPDDGERRHFADRFADASDAARRNMAQAYLDSVWQLAPHSRFITDKMPANFFYIGLIALLFPHARIIHSLRDPMDSCLSNFSQRFNQTMEFTYDLQSLGRFYVRYIDMMRHWHQVLPAGTILDVAYEDVVADTEAQVRRVLDYVGLPFDERCLEFHHNKRSVHTASMAQVRRPIYKSSVARWERFGEERLRPLFELVAPYRDLGDRYGTKRAIDSAADKP